MVAVIVTILTTVLAAFIWEKVIRDRVSVRRVESSSDADAVAVVDLYESLFPQDGTNYSIDELAELFDVSTVHSPMRHVTSDNLMLVAKFHGAVIGFLFCHFYPVRRLGIISYFGIDKSLIEARQHAAKKLLNRLRRFLVNGNCRYVFFDLRKEDAKHSTSVNGKRRARPRKFTLDARTLGFKAHQLNLDYRCPRVSLADDTIEEPLILMCVPICEKLPIPTPRKLVLEFLRFIYLDCYGDFYPVGHPQFKPYREYLEQGLLRFEKALPRLVNVS